MHYRASFLSFSDISHLKVKKGLIIELIPNCTLFFMEVKVLYRKLNMDNYNI